MSNNVNIELFDRFIKNPVLRLYSLSVHSSKKLLTFLWNKWLEVATIVPGADVIFLGILLKEIKLYVLYPFHLSDGCGGLFVSWIYDLYVTYIIVIGCVIYATRRYLSKRRAT